MRLTLGFSPCPNDTFIFDALVNKKIDTGGLDFDIQLEDVQTLNEWAKESKLHFSKISYGVLPLVLENYVVLNSGGALGKGVGPLLVSTSPIKNLESEISNLTVAVPGENTTANMLFSLAFPKAINKKFLVFNEIEDAVLSGKADAGVIIHENRFTYQQKGLVKLMDLGEYWEKTTSAPIPLGGIVAKRTLAPELIKKVDRLITESVQYSLKNYPLLSSFIRDHAQEMQDDVIRKHIDLYVNDYSLHLGDEGRKAVKKLLHVFKYNDDGIFID